MRTLILYVLLMLFLLAGCSVYPIQMVLVNSKRLDKQAGVVQLNNPNNVPGSIKQIARNDGSTYFSWEIDEKIEQTKTFRVKYHWLYYPVFHYIVVEGQVGNNKRKYPIILDTGTSLPIFVHDIHILQNKLPIYPFKSSEGLSAGIGFCYLPQLRVGEANFIDWPAIYQEKHVEIQFFGLPFARDEAIILGLPALKKFKYVLFDGPRKEVEFSLHQTWNADKSEIWGLYVFSIEEDSNGNAFLFVEIFIAGENMKLQLDTGSGQGLAIREKLWERIHNKFSNLKLKAGLEHYPFFGKLPCRKGIIKDLEVGGRKVKNAKISIFPDDGVLMSVKNRQGLLGMQYFRDTVLVLDFEHQIMWVKNLQKH